MATVFELAERMDEVIAGLDNEISNILNEVEPIIVEQQKERLFQGKYVSGNEIIPEYKPYTIFVKHYLKSPTQPTDRVTLKDTGDFYNQIFAAQLGNEVLIDSGDEKSGMLKEKYEKGGESLFGFTEDNVLQNYAITTPMLTDYTKRITGLP